MTKYRAKPTTIAGIRFASRAEANRYLELSLLQKAGEIASLQTHPRFTVWQHGKEKIIYEADFSYYEDGQQVVEDVKGGKGTQTAVFKLKARMFKAMYPDIRFVIVER